MTSVPGFDSNEMLEGLRQWVEIESPSDNAEAVNRMVSKVEGDFAALGATTERIPGKNGFGDCLRVRSPWGGDGPGILVLAHLDTVHPMGTLERLPFRVEGDTAYGPGIYDMKGGGYIGYYGYQSLVRQNKQTSLPITFLFNSDEEVSSRVSRHYIMDEAKKNKYVLVLEPARDNGEVVVARKGTARFHIEFTGRPSHAGSKHADGRSAIKEMARQIVEMENMTDYEKALTVNVGVVSGGTRPNVISEFATCEVDMRLPTRALADEMIPRIQGLRPFDPDVKMEITGGAERPPFEQTEASTALFETARTVAADLGIPLEAAEQTGGASDANFANPYAPSLDGLGVLGKGAHTLDEQIRISSLGTRCSLFYRMLETLE